MKKGIQPSGMVTRRKILTVSMKLFLEKGYEGTTAKEVADMAGIVSGSPFFQFGNKEGVLLDLVKQMFDGQFATAGMLAGEGRTRCASSTLRHTHCRAPPHIFTRT